MSIQFNCPVCKSLIAFPEKHAGKVARCLTCGQRLTIPAHSGQVPAKVKPPKEVESPLPGFYHAVFIDSWRVFLSRNSITQLAFVVAAVCFKFFSSGACCIAHIAYFAAWGYLFGFYLQIVCETAAGIDELPEIEVGTTLTFVWEIFRPFLIFIFTLFIVELPFFVAFNFFAEDGATIESIWKTPSAANVFLCILFSAGLFMFPMAILTVAVVNSLVDLLRFDLLLIPVFRAFLPYMVVVGLLAAACCIEANTSQYQPVGREPLLTIAAKLAVNLAVQIVAIVAMRATGLYYRHYACYFRHL